MWNHGSFCYCSSEISCIVKSKGFIDTIKHFRSSLVLRVANFSYHQIWIVEYLVMYYLDHPAHQFQ